MRRILAFLNLGAGIASYCFCKHYKNKNSTIFDQSCEIQSGGDFFRAPQLSDQEQLSSPSLRQRNILCALLFPLRGVNRREKERC